MNDSLPDQSRRRLLDNRRSRLVVGMVGLALLVLVGLSWWLVNQHRGAPAMDFPGGPGGGPPGGGPPGGRPRPGGPAGGPGGPVSTVGVATAVVGGMPITLEALGTVTPTATVTVKPQVSGVITQVNYEEGQLVNVGDVLAVIDPRPYEAARLSAQGTLEKDGALLEAAQITLKRYLTLQAQDSIAGQDVDTQAATVKQYEGTVLTDQAALRTAALNLEFTRIKAPVKGRVGLRVLDIGNYIAAGDSNGVVVITVLDPIDVVFALPQDAIPSIRKRVYRDHAKLTVTALDRTRLVPLAEGEFRTLDNQVNTGTGTVRAKAVFANTNGDLFPNQFVNVMILLDTEQNATLVPAAAVRAGADGAFVYVFDERSSTVQMRSVKQGQSNGDKTAITAGLKPGEQVIVEGGDRLVDGARVQLPGAASRPGAPPGRIPPASGKPPTSAPPPGKRSADRGVLPAADA